MPIPHLKQAYLKPMLWVAFFLLFGVSTLQTQAQPNPEARPIQYGERVSGSLASREDEIRWTFAGRAGEIILLDMVAPLNSRLDPRLQVVDGANHLIAEAQIQGGAGATAHIGPLILPTDGTYEIITGTYEGLGDFILYLHSIDQLPTLAPDKPLEIRFDAAWELRYLRYDSPDAAQWRFIVEPLDTSAQVPLITLYSLEGEILSSSAYRRSGLIDPFMSQADELYIMGLHLLYADYPLESSSRPFSVLLNPSEINFLADQDRQRGTISAEQAFPEHYFLAQAGDTVQISLRPLNENISPSMVVTGGVDDSILFSGNSAHTQHLSLSLSIPSDGLYVIRINDGAYSPNGGDYELEFMRQPAD